MVPFHKCPLRSYTRLREIVLAGMPGLLTWHKKPPSSLLFHIRAPSLSLTWALASWTSESGFGKERESPWRCWGASISSLQTTSINRWHLLLLQVSLRLALMIQSHLSSLRPACPPCRLYIELPLRVCFPFLPETSACAALGSVWIC